MTRIYYLANNIHDADMVSHALHDNGIADWQLHVLSNDLAGIKKHHLHQANVFQKSDILHSALIGSVYGIAAGFYLFLFIYPWAISSAAFLYGIPAGLVLLGTIIGSLWGCTHKNSNLLRFHDDITNGSALIIIDAMKSQCALLKNYMRHEFPSLLFDKKKYPYTKHTNFNH